LAGSIKDTIVDFMIDKQRNTLAIQNITGYIGQFYNRVFALDEITVTAIEKPYLKTDNIAWFASHRHLEYPSKNDAYQYCFMYKYEIAILEGAKTITLPQNDKIKVFAITVANNELDNIKVLQPLVDDFKDSKSVQLR
jgi:alpha-mannosidase